MAKVYNAGGFDDTPSRLATIKFLKEVFNLNFELGTRYGIDTVCIDDPTWGAEVEQSKTWTGDFFSSQNKGLNNKSGLGFMTVNIPWWRKAKYWAQDNPGKDKNMYVRMNKDASQVIVIEAQSFHNPEMCLESHFKTGWITTGEVEEWRSFRREHVRVFNLINGVYIEDKIEVLC